MIVMGISFSNGKASFRTNYSDTMIDDPAFIISKMREEMKGVKYDTIVGRGTSGMLIVPLVAKALRKKWLVVRKPEEYESSHSGVKWLGDLGKRWIFLDDFCSSGRTFREVRDGIKDAVTAVNRAEKWDDVSGTFIRNNFKTELVGYFEYERRASVDGANVGWHTWDEDAQPGYSDSYTDDTPKAAAARAEKEAQRQRREEAAGKRTPTPTTPPPDPAVSIPNPDYCCELCTPDTPRTLDNAPATLDYSVSRGVPATQRVQSKLDERVAEMLYGKPLPDASVPGEWAKRVSPVVVRPGSTIKAFS